MAAILDPKFCSQCGAPMTKRVPEGDHRPRHACSRCGFVHYLDPKVACGSIPESDGRIVLIRRNIEPRLGTWTFPCGFMEVDETVEEAARRETKEETGLAVELTDPLGTFSYSDTWWGGSIVVVAFASRVVGGELCAGTDAGEARLFRTGEIPWGELAFRSSVAALRAWFSRKGIPSPPEA
ncbi:MAG: NUDIX hydrolase [Planctomycetes bacterium]|nr:NUDIX hydrolase [Planctomycetota bacterium]